MKKLLSLTAAALLLITTGCGRSNAPSASASSTAPSVSAPITEPTVESSDDTAPTVQKDEAAAKPQNSRRLDDSRIIPLYSERFTYTDPNGIEDTYFYEVPQIDDDTEDAKHINEMINYRYGYLVERAQDARSRNDFIDTGFIIWVSNWNGPVLSLQVTSSDTLFNHDVGSYHYNFATGQELTNLDLLEYMGYTDSAKTLNALQRATAQHFDVHFGGYDPEYTAMLYKMRAQSLSELDSVFTYYSIFPHFSNGFVVTVPMYTPAESGMYWTDVQVDPNKRQASGQVLHGQDEWFTCDVTATGKVTVRALDPCGTAKCCRSSRGDPYQGRRCCCPMWRALGFRFGIRRCRSSADPRKFQTRYRCSHLHTSRSGWKVPSGRHCAWPRPG